MPPIKKELRERIRQLLRAGDSQAAIAAKLDKAPSTIAHHVRALGQAPKKYVKTLPVHRGKRRCVICRVMKTIGAFPNPRNSTCTVCVRAKK